jgi:hypothetical protein
MLKDWTLREIETARAREGSAESAQDRSEGPGGQDDSDALAFLVWTERNRSNLVEGYISEREELRQTLSRYSGDVLQAVEAIRRAAKEQSGDPPPPPQTKRARYTSST